MRIKPQPYSIEKSLFNGFIAFSDQRQTRCSMLHDIVDADVGNIYWHTNSSRQCAEYWLL